MGGKSIFKSTMTKSDIVEKVYEKIGFSKKESSKFVEMVFDTIKDKLVEGEKVKISGFGKFEIHNKRPRIGRNPQTGKQITISARKVLSFSPSQILKSMLNMENEKDQRGNRK